jgi:hypothetical protein
MDSTRKNVLGDESDPPEDPDAGGTEELEQLWLGILERKLQRIGIGRQPCDLVTLGRKWRLAQGKFTDLAESTFIQGSTSLPFGTPL